MGLDAHSELVGRQSKGARHASRPETTFLKRNPGTEEKPHGAFVALTDGSFTTSTFIHAPGGVLPPAREGDSQHNCDGKGIDSLEVCFGG